MSAIDEGIVREYFEQNGFLVRQVRKYQVQSRRKTGDEEVDLIVYNPAYARTSRRRWLVSSACSTVTATTSRLNGLFK